MAGKAKKPTPTPAKVWRQPREEGYVVTLPGGNNARLRPVAMDRLITSGAIPDLLSPLAAKMLFEETDVEQIANAVDLATSTAELFDHVCKAAFLEPRIVDEIEKPDEEITLDDLCFADKMLVFQLAIQPAEVLRKFRDRQAAGVDAVLDGEDDEPKAE